jgi:hypothetical protein
VNRGRARGAFRGRGGGFVSRRALVLGIDRDLRQEQEDEHLQREGWEDGRKRSHRVGLLVTGSVAGWRATCRRRTGLASDGASPLPHSDQNATCAASPRLKRLTRGLSSFSLFSLASACAWFTRTLVHRIFCRTGSRRPATLATATESTKGPMQIMCTCCTHSTRFRQSRTFRVSSLAMPRPHPGRWRLSHSRLAKVRHGDDGALGSASKPESNFPPKVDDQWRLLMKLCADRWQLPPKLRVLHVDGDITLSEPSSLLSDLDIQNIITGASP